MKSKRVIVLFIAFAFTVSCGKQIEKKVVIDNIQTDTLKAKIEVSLEIVKSGKIYFGNSKHQTDSTNGFLLKTTIKNLSADSFKFYLFYCSYIYMLDFEPKIKIPDIVCDYNPWDLYCLSKNQKIDIYLWILDPTELWYFQDRSKLRVGFIQVSKEEERQANIIDILTYKVKKRKDIFWSNYIDLKEYIPTIRTKTFKDNFIIKDSLDNVISVLSKEIN